MGTDARNTLPNFARAAEQKSSPGHGAMAMIAVVLSFFALVLPLGIAAVVLGHIAIARNRTGRGQPGRTPMARAALIIGYVQMAIASFVLFAGWLAFHGMQQQLRADPEVQEMMHKQDALRTLDAGEVTQEEKKARAILTELAARENEYQRRTGGYLCDIQKLVSATPAGTASEQSEDFGRMIEQSPYAYELRECGDSGGPANAAHYALTAAPRLPRMPDSAGVYCTDQLGVVREVRSGTSLDCLLRGTPVQ